jgi:hypothetical protein
MLYRVHGPVDVKKTHVCDRRHFPDELTKVSTTFSRGPLARSLTAIYMQVLLTLKIEGCVLVNLFMISLTSL